MPHALFASLANWPWPMANCPDAARGRPADDPALRAPAAGQGARHAGRGAAGRCRRGAGRAARGRRLAADAARAAEGAGGGPRGRWTHPLGRALRVGRGARAGVRRCDGGRAAVPGDRELRRPGDGAGVRRAARAYRRRRVPGAVRGLRPGRPGAAGRARRAGGALVAALGDESRRAAAVAGMAARAEEPTGRGWPSRPSRSTGTRSAPEGTCLRVARVVRGVRKPRSPLPRPASAGCLCGRRIGHAASGQLAMQVGRRPPWPWTPAAPLVAIWPTGRVSLRARPPQPTYPPGYQLAPHVGMTVRRGRVVVFDHGVVRWRSRGQLATGLTNPTAAAAGPGGLAFVLDDALYVAARPAWPVRPRGQRPRAARRPRRDPRRRHGCRRGHPRLAMGAPSLSGGTGPTVERPRRFDSPTAARPGRARGCWSPPAGGSSRPTVANWPRSPAAFPPRPGHAAGRRRHRAHHGTPGARPEPERPAALVRHRFHRARRSDVVLGTNGGRAAFASAPPTAAA